MILLNCQTGWANVENRLGWILEQITTPRLLENHESLNFQTIVQATNYKKAISSCVGIQLNTSLMEFGVRMSNRYFPFLSGDAGTFKSVNLNDRLTLGVEFARTYTNVHRHHARLGVEYIRFEPSKLAFIRIGANTGIPASSEVPWLLRFNFHVLVVQRAASESGITPSTSFIISTDIGKNMVEHKTGHLRIGGLISWIYRPRVIPEDEPHSQIRYEHMLISLGPWLEYGGSTNLLRISAPWRIWLDREIFARTVPAEPGQTKTVFTSRYPHDLVLPDISLSWTLFF